MLVVGSTAPGDARPGEGVWGRLSVTLTGIGHAANSGLVKDLPAAYTGAQGVAVQKRWGGLVRDLPEPSLDKLGPGAAILGTWNAKPSRQLEGLEGTEGSGTIETKRDVQLQDVLPGPLPIANLPSNKKSGLNAVEPAVSIPKLNEPALETIKSLPEVPALPALPTAPRLLRNEADVMPITRREAATPVAAMAKQSQMPMLPMPLPPAPR